MLRIINLDDVNASLADRLIEKCKINSAICLREYFCKNRHHWPSVVSFGHPTALSGEHDSCCPYCKEVASYSSPWRVVVSDQDTGFLYEAPNTKSA